jgi:hypothetical protein
MTPFMRTRALLAAVLTVVGVVFVCLPDTWIEMWFGVDPDGGNGWIEAILAAAPLTLSLGMGFEVFLRLRRRSREEAAKSAPSSSVSAPKAGA